LLLQQVTGAIKSICLSHDKELLSIATASSIHIRNLSSNTTVALRDLPTNIGGITFHPTRRSTLVAYCGSQLIVFDVNKPASPLRNISLASRSEVVDAVFLSGSKSLLAVAMVNGDVHVVDLEKEKS